MKTNETTAEAMTPPPWNLVAIYKHVALEGDLDGWRLTAPNSAGIESSIAYIKRHNGNFDGPTQEANAEFIVEAVNNHARLIASHKSLRDVLIAVLNCPDYCATRPEDNYACKATMEFRRILDQARLALGQADKLAGEIKG